MKNTAKVHTDGINVYVTSRVKANPIGKFFLTFFTVVLGSLFVFLFTKIEGKDVGKILLPAAIGGFLYYYFIVCYTLWNWFGVEELIINLRSVSVSFDYGFYRTNLKTLPVHKLAFTTSIIQKNGDLALGRLFLYNYREEDHLPELLLQSTILIPETRLQEIDAMIQDLFDRAFYETNRFIPYSEN